MQRRHFMTNAAMAAAGAALTRPRALAAARAQSFFAAHGIPIGVQLYTLSPQLNADFAGTLAAVARVGYRSVETAGFHGRSGAQLRAAFDSAGLICRSAHVQAQQRGADLGLSGDLGRLSAEMHAIGVETVVMPIFVIPDRLAPAHFTLETFRAAGLAMEADDWKRNADFLNEKARVLAANGLKTNYHNHNFEFRPLGSQSGFSILLERTDPALVSFELDAGWAAAAGLDPVALLAAHPQRFRQMHVKDIKASTVPNFEIRQDPVEVGGGSMDWKRILPAAYAAGVRRFYVEQEPPYVGDRLDVLATSYRYLATLDA